MKTLGQRVLLLVVLVLAGCAQLDPRSTQIAVPPAAQIERHGDGANGGGDGM